MRKDSTAQKTRKRATPSTPSAIDVTCTLFHGTRTRVVRTIREPWADFVGSTLPDLLSRTVPAPDDDSKEAWDAAKEAQQSFILAPVDGTRGDETVGDHTSVVIDVDAVPGDDLDAFREVCSRYKCAVYESASSRERGKGPRVRVIGAISKEIPRNQIKAARRAFARDLGLDPVAAGVTKADAKSQIMFIGSIDGTSERGLWAYDGEIWTPPNDLEEYAPAQPATQGRVRQPTRGADEIPTLPPLLIRAIEAMGPDGHRCGGRRLMRGLAAYARGGWHPDGIYTAVRDQVPSSQSAVRADQAREAAEAWYSGESKTAGVQAIRDHFRELTGSDALGDEIIQALEPDIEDPWITGAVKEYRLCRQRLKALKAIAAPANDTCTPEGDVLQCVSWNEIMAPLPPVKWLCERLGIAAGGGRPNIFAGKSGGGKTLSAQALALAVASGGKIFGEFPCMQGGVLHIDLEQGVSATNHRYQQLARGLGLGDAQLDLQCSFFGLSLTKGGQIDQDAAAKLERSVRGKILVILDSLKALSPGLDEQSSDMRMVLDCLTAISHRTGVTWLVIHHSGKSDGTELRGSSAIKDAAGAVWVITRDDSRVTWQVEKTSEHALEPPHGFATTLQLQRDGWVESAVLALDSDSTSTQQTGEEVTHAERVAVAEYLVLHPDGESQNQAELALKKQMGRNRFREVLSVMIDHGDLVREGSKATGYQLHPNEKTETLATSPPHRRSYLAAAK